MVVNNQAAIDELWIELHLAQLFFCQTSELNQTGNPAPICPISWASNVPPFAGFEMPQVYFSFATIRSPALPQFNRA
jgi:hypothetical protein